MKAKRKAKINRLAGKKLRKALQDIRSCDLEFTKDGTSVVISISGEGDLILSPGIYEMDDYEYAKTLSNRERMDILGRITGIDALIRDLESAKTTYQSQLKKPVLLKA